MIDNYFQRAITVLLMGIMALLIGMLWFEYCFFCRQAQELVALKQHYYTYITDMQKKIDGDNVAIVNSEENVLDVQSMQEDENSIIAKEISIAQASDDPDDDDDFDQSSDMPEEMLTKLEVLPEDSQSFMIINRQPDYLKQSAMDYVQTQELDALMTAVDIKQWSHYNEQAIVPIQDNKKTAFIASKPSQKKSYLTEKKPIKDFGLIWPIDKDKFWLSSHFGPRKRTNGTWGFHHGIDMAAPKGTLIKAARSGHVVEAHFQTGYGNTVVIQHTPHIKTRYAHLHAIRVRVGQVVKAGTIVGTVGETGFIRKQGKDGSHLHFEVYENGKRVNPLHCLPRAG